MARASGKVVRGEVDDNTDFKTSAKFFKRMQDDVQQTIKDDDTTGAKKRKYGDSETGKSSKFKL